MARPLKWHLLVCLIFTSTATSLAPLLSHAQVSSEDAAVAKLDLGFLVRSIDLSPDNRYLVAWGSKDSYSLGGSDEVAVYDVQEKKLLAKQTFSPGIRCATIDGQYVYLATYDANVFSRYDMKLEEAKRMILKLTPKRLMKISPDVLVIKGKGYQAFNVKTMKPIALEEISGVNMPRQEVYFLDRNEIQIGRKVVHPLTGKTIRTEGLLNLSDLPAIASGVQLQNFQSAAMARSKTLSGLMRWGRSFSKGSLANFIGNRIADPPQFKDTRSERIFTAKWNFISKKMPMAVVFRKVRDGENEKFNMHLLSLHDGSIKRTVVIAVLNKSFSINSNTYRERNTIVETDDQIIVSLGTELIFVDMPTDIASTFVTPTHFVRTAPPVLEVGGFKKYKIPVNGKLEGVHFNLQAGDPRIEINSKTGELTIDTQSMWDAIYNKKVDYAANANSYKFLTGEDLPANKLAYYIPLSVVLLEPKGMEDGFQLNLIIVGPQKQSNDEIAEIKKDQSEISRAKEEAVNEPQSPVSKGIEQPPETAAENDQVETENLRRIEKLEQSIGRLELKIESVLKRLKN